MSIYYETLPPVDHGLFKVYPILWHYGDICGLDHVEFVTPFGDTIRWPVLPEKN